MSEIIRLSYTAAKRYERCPYLQWTHKNKLTDAADDEKPFFVGRVLHEAAEVFVARRGLGCNLVDFIPGAWASNEAEVTERGTVIWGAEERAAAWVRVIELARTLDAMLRASGLFLHHQLAQEPRTFVYTGHGHGMYANPDILCVVGSVGFIGELKSGSSYDPEQPAWYAEVFSRLPELAHVHTWVALPIRPAVSSTITPVVVETSKRTAQRDRATAISQAMLAGKWETKPGYYCNFCEARSICPSYQGTYGHLTPGRVGLGNL